MMGGTTKQASGAAATENALTAMTAERDEALAQIATFVGQSEQFEKDLALVTGERDKALTDLATMTGERDQANGLVAELTKSLEAAQADLAAMAAERDGAAAELAAANKAVAKGKTDLAKARAKAAPKPAKLRAIGPVADQPRGEDLLTLIGAADTVELVFSDGKRELGSLPPQLIEGDAWAMAANGIRLRGVSLPVHGPAHGQPPIKLAGYGLVLDGELTAYAARIDVFALQPNAQADLKDDVIFN